MNKYKSLISYGKELTEKGVRLFDEMDDKTYNILGSMAIDKVQRGAFLTLEEIICNYKSYSIKLSFDSKINNQYNFNLNFIQKY